VVSTAASQRQGAGYNSSLSSLSVWSLHLLPESAWVSSGCCHTPKDVRVRWIGLAKLPLVSQGVQIRMISRVNMWGHGDSSEGRCSFRVSVQIDGPKGLLH